MHNIISLFLLITGFTSQAQITDIDGNSYDTVRIGSQTWMAENLNVSRFRNGDTILEARTDEEWKTAGENQQPAWCYVFNDSGSSVLLGKLYNWYAVNDSRGLAPEGWHVASDADWAQLTDHLGGSTIAGPKMKDTSQVNIDAICGLNYRFINDSACFSIYWPSNFDISVIDNNESGLTVRAGAVRSEKGSFPHEFRGDMGAHFWTSSIGRNEKRKVVIRSRYSKESRTYSMKKLPVTRYLAGEDEVYRMTEKEGQGLFVRCIKD
jgi:uncharacterized protein (TIGR02145 family)